MAGNDDSTLLTYALDVEDEKEDSDGLQSHRRKINSPENLEENTKYSNTSGNPEADVSSNGNEFSEKELAAIQLAKDDLQRYKEGTKTSEEASNEQSEEPTANSEDIFGDSEIVNMIFGREHRRVVQQHEKKNSKFHREQRDHSGNAMNSNHRNQYEVQPEDDHANSIGGIKSATPTINSGMNNTKVTLSNVEINQLPPAEDEQTKLGEGVIKEAGPRRGNRTINPAIGLITLEITERSEERVPENLNRFNQEEFSRASPDGNLKEIAGTSVELKRKEPANPDENLASTKYSTQSHKKQKKEEKTNERNENERIPQTRATVRQNRNRRHRE